MIGYENVDEQKLLGLFYSKGSLSAMPLLKDTKVFATDCYKSIYIDALCSMLAYELIAITSLRNQTNLKTIKAYDKVRN